MSSTVHEPVLLVAALRCLAVKAHGIYVDGTFGRGGHSQAILQQLADDGRLLVMDRDLSAIEHARAQFGADPRVLIIHDDFSNMKAQLAERDLLRRVDGVLLDIGVSSPQLDDAKRGFSFSKDGPLDMRMDTSQGESAADWVNRASKEDITYVLKTYGEERFAKRIAHAIVTAREEVRITTTTQLANIIKSAVPKFDKHKHPATRSFQGIRIFINDELGQLERCLNDILDILAVGGRLAVISFHSLEDRMVKQFIKKYSEEPVELKRLPLRPDYKKRLRKCGKEKASADEVSRNPRARSAILRAMEKIDE